MNSITVFVKSAINIQLNNNLYYFNFLCHSLYPANDEYSNLLDPQCNFCKLRNNGNNVNRLFKQSNSFKSGNNGNYVN